MTIEQMEIPVAEMGVQEPVKGRETKYAITLDGTVVEAEALKENPEAFRDAIE